jgi:hypothetical protein
MNHSVDNVRPLIFPADRLPSLRVCPAKVIPFRRRQRANPTIVMAIAAIVLSIAAVTVSLAALRSVPDMARGLVPGWPL